ncbi:rhomboid family intramembrane serine protease [Dokdonia sinensis]|uniref:Rhomboid family intramembrane serine protease n=1 Tax=Dokdonia sinensis TaxID=2479847 RepID=A0A3M0GDL3_9FLAO|nr:rhomboid family intramembrane serine protease [Dokdonia sinensis]RMB62810.1 rhomboid family intramembrane serine protease [Dokdonia sinensis]
MSREEESFPFYYGVVLYPLLFVLVIWTVMWVEVTFHVDFTTYGVRPQTVKGLRGIFFSPFIHSGVTHLWHNTIPIFVLAMALFYFYKKISWAVLFWILILSGLGTWLLGRPSYHIGMSGIIYGLVSFLFFKGIFAKHYRLIALSLVVVFLYGGLIWGALPIKAGVSWEGHLAGLIAGLLLAFRFRESVPLPAKYIWEKPDYNAEDDPFMKQFDENGNFIEIEPEEPLEEVEIHYEYKESKLNDTEGL